MEPRRTSDQLTGEEDGLESNLSNEEASKVNTYILAKLKERLKLKTDAELAEKLGCATSYITLIRSGRRDFSLHMKLKMLDKIGYLAFRDLLLALTPNGLAQTISQLDNKRLDLDISYKENPLPGKFSELVADAIRMHGPDSVAAAVKVELMKHAAANLQSR